MTDSLSIDVHASHVFMSFSEDEMLLPSSLAFDYSYDKRRSILLLFLFYFSGITSGAKYRFCVCACASFFFKFNFCLKKSLSE